LDDLESIAARCQNLVDAGKISAAEGGILLAGELQRRQAAANYFKPGRKEAAGVQNAQVAVTEPKRAKPPATDILPLNHKVWPMLGLSAIKHRRHGAWRAWETARHLDQAGSGRVDPDKLLRYFKEQGLEPRTRRRWVADALRLGLLRKTTGGLYYVNLAIAAINLECFELGIPANIHIENIFHKGWRSLIFDAYNATLPGPMSQRRKHALTRITPRTQRNYQRCSPGISRTNFARREEPADHVHGLRHERGLAVFTDGKNRIIQRLPDIRVIPPTVATRAPMGRTRQAQKIINASRFLGRRSAEPIFKLFHESDKGARQAVRRIGRSEAPKKPLEIFKLNWAGTTSNRWEVVSVPF